MRDLAELNWNDGAEAVLALLPRLTVLRGMLETEPIRALGACCSAVLEGDIRRAAEEVFSMTSALLSGGYRRVTGDLFKDFLLHELLLEPHPFAVNAASNRLDEALYSGIKEDMEILAALAGLDGETLYRFVQERFKELRQKARPSRDSAARLAEAAWGGGTVRPEPAEEPKPIKNLPAFLPGGAPNWQYGEEELRDSYAADEALEEMYHRFLEGGLEWQTMAEDVWNFFAAYGTGVFLKHRLFCWQNGRLAPMEDMRQASGPAVLEREYLEARSHVIEFMRDNGAEPMLICGPDGMGKTNMLFSLADELPELRFVYAPGCNGFGELAPLFDLIKGQPLKFMVALDDPKSLGFALRALPVNVLVAAATGDAELSGAASFTKKICLPQLRLDGFTEIVQMLLGFDGADVPRERVRSACVDHQVDSRGELTVAAAVAVARALKG